MLDIKLIREHPESVKAGLAKKGVSASTINQILDLDTTRRKLLQEVESLKAQRNQANDQITKAKRENASAESIIASMKSISQKIGDLDLKVGEYDDKIATIIVNIPNIPHE